MKFDEFIYYCCDAICRDACKNEIKSEVFMQKQDSSMSITSTYVATAVGVGYVSGQEILQYFSYFQENRIFAIIIASIFWLFTCIVSISFSCKRLSYGD